MGEVSAEKAELQWQLAEQTTTASQLRQRLQGVEAKLLDTVREQRTEAEACEMLAECKKQLQSVEESKLSVMEGGIFMHLCAF